VLIDWFTVIAQIINFLILVLLLRRFLYKPILNAMQERERKVAERLESAKQERVRAEEERERYESLAGELRQHAEQKKRESEEEVAIWRKENLQQARQDVDNAKQSWRKALEQEQQAFAAELREFTVRQSYAVAGKALRDLADIDLEERLLTRFIARLENGEVPLDKLNAGDELTVRSAFDLSDKMREQIAGAVQKSLGRKIALNYETSPELGAGIEIESAEGYQVAWNLNRYLQVLEEDLSGQLQSNKAA
jgi:F-type H+-transporting ATPase subunit b